MGIIVLTTWKSFAGLAGWSGDQITITQSRRATLPGQTRPSDRNWVPMETKIIYTNSSPSFGGGRGGILIT